VANKIIKIAVKDIEGLQSSGEYRLRYRIKSKDGTRKSEWSDITNLSYPINENGQVSSFYELYVPTSGRPNLSDGAGDDPHPSNGYTVSTVNSAIDAAKYVKSSITPLTDDSGIYTYSWSSIDDYPVTQKFDVYLSWKSTTAWSDWIFSGTTTANNFSFKKPLSTYQFVQAAVFLSSYPKLTNIYGTLAETTFVSISPTLSTYSSSTTGTIGSLTGSGPYRATITGLTNLPASGVISGRRVFATSGSGNFGSGAVTVVSTSSEISMVVTSPNIINTGTVTDVRL
jgi:hypothetical protein